MGVYATCVRPCSPPYNSHRLFSLSLAKMNLFKRSKSAIAKRQQDSNPLPSSRPPLTNNNRTADNVSLSADRSNVQGPQLLDRKINYRNVDEYGKAKSSQYVHAPYLHVPFSHFFRSAASHSTDALDVRGLSPAPLRTSTKTTYVNHPDLYTHNDLNTFSFGAAPSLSSSSYPHPVDPLSRPRDEVDSDEPFLIPDTTPRPSVVASQYPRSHQSQPSGLENRQTPFFDPRLKPSPMGVGSAGKLKERDTDMASNHTFGNSSASVSVSSFSAQREVNSRATSRISRRSSTTPQTSSNDLTSDEEFDGRHPLPPEPLDPVSPVADPDQASSLYLSEDEYDGYNEDYENDGVDIDSEIQCGTLSDHPNDSRDSFRVNSSERRDSVAMQIPNTASDRAYEDYRARGNSLVTLRRPSKSLEDLYSFSFGKSSGPSSSRVPEDPLPSTPTPTSVPESEGDWRDLRKRSVQRDKDLPSIFPSPTAASGPKVNLNMASTSASSVNDLLGFDSSWMQSYGVNGVVGFDPSEMADIVGQGQNGYRPSLYSFRKGSTSSAFRRQSTVSGNNIDIMHKNIAGVWANQKFRDQRELWTFTKEKDRIEDEGANPNTRPQVVAERERSSISTLFATRPSTSNGVEPILGGSIPFFDKPEPKEKVAVKEKSKEIWKGMALDSEEIWTNGSSGRFRVNRRNAACTYIRPFSPHYS